MIDGMKCPYCDSDQMGKAGFAVSEKDGIKVQRYKCKQCKRRTKTPTGVDNPPVFQTALPSVKRYLITAAQNATPVNRKFLESLRQYCKHTGAELIVIPIRYRNPTSIWTEDNKKDDWWDAELAPHLFDGQLAINDQLTIMADIKIIPTMVSPLAGLETITGSKSGIIAHPKIELKTIPTPNHKFPKVMSTTGAVTEKNYIDCKAGKKGEFHHSFGACLIEVAGDVFHMRQINAMRDGTFVEMMYHYTPTGRERLDRIEALVMGDSHVDFMDPQVYTATFKGPQSMVSVLRPKYLVWHDVLDFYSGSHHHRRNPIIGVAKNKAGKDNVREEVERAVKFIIDHTPEDTTSILVPSNHHEHLGRWVMENEWRTDPVNAEFQLESALDMVQSAEMTPSGAKYNDPFHYWFNKLSDGSRKVRLLEMDESCMIKNIECGMHGDKGSNGSRGSLLGFSKIGVKSIIGHTHTPGIREGVYQVGTSSLTRLEYTHGPSSWLNTHAIIYGRGGKRTLTNIINGQWRIPLAA